jgi:serine/threonine-protein kinase ULK/ATG1
VTLYYMCFREYPFKGFYASEVKLIELMKKEQIEFPKHTAISSQMK